MTTASGPAASLTDREPLFQLDGISLERQGREILPPLTLSLEAGRVHALIGLNGSGKSTLLNILARQIRPDAGSLHFLGQRLTDYGGRELARLLAYMPQFPPSSDGMRVRDLVALGRFAWHGTLGRFTHRDRDKVEDALAATGLTAMADRVVDSLSGGERQRAWLAMMIAQDTRCLLLDEPTSALDIPHQVDMLELLRDLARSRDMSAVVVLHDINMAARVADRIVALEAGRVIANGTPDAVMRADVLSRIYRVEMHTMPHPASGKPIGFPA